MPIDNDLKEFISLTIGGIKNELVRLSDVVEKTDVRIRNIETQTITRLTELQNGVENNKDDIGELRTYLMNREKEIEREMELRQSSDLGIENKLSILKDDQIDKWEKQAVINQSIADLRKVLWAIFLVLLSIMVGFVWELIKSGGIRGLAT